jgi:hypothetical protein
MNELTDRLSTVGVIDEPRMEEYLCECADAECMERITLAREEYEHVRSNPLWFFVALGHVVPDIERVVSENQRFTVVEKGPGERDIVMATDPRR